MTTKDAQKPSAKPVAKRKVTKKRLTFVEVREAAKGGNDAYAYFVANGKLPVAK